MQIENIPEELKRVPHWVTRTGKQPVNPHTLFGAKANDPQTWGTFETALHRVGQTDKKGKRCDGIGFALRN